MKAPRRLYVTSDRSRVVNEGDKSAAFLLCPAGAEIPPDAVKRYGLDKATATTPEQKAEQTEGSSPVANEVTQTRPARGVRTR
jgi:hypothetical protein